MTLPAGKQIGRYQLIELIGTGGIASVYQAFDPLFDRNVALKLMHTPFMVQEEFRKRFLREAQATARLRHPGIVEILDYGESTDHQHYIVMEFVPGPNLEQLITQLRQAQRQIPLPEVTRLMGQLGEAIAFANEHGVLHRDIKPANILMKPRLANQPGELLPYDPLVTDFGLARLEGGADVTQPGVSVGGTPAYMAPEQLDNVPLDERCDVYSLGVIFYELVTGQLPYPLKTLQEAVRQHSLHALPLTPPKQLRPDLPDALNTLISQMIEPLPAQRLPSARAMLQALRAAPSSPPPIAGALDKTVPDLRVSDLSTPAKRPSEPGVNPNVNTSVNANVGAGADDRTISDATIPAFNVPAYAVPKPPAQRPAQPVRPPEKGKNSRASNTDPNMTLVAHPPSKRNPVAIILTCVMIVIAAILVWYFVTKLQGSNNGTGTVATVATSAPTQPSPTQASNASATTLPPTAAPEATTAASSKIITAESQITQPLAAPLTATVSAPASAPVTAPVSATASATISTPTSIALDPNLTMTATVIGPNTSHPTQVWIDGDLTDWQVLRALSKSKTTTLEAQFDQEGTAGCQARFPQSTAAVDFGAEVQLAYDTTNLYVSFLVHDDGFVTNSDPAKYDQGDGAQLLLKLNVDSATTPAPGREDEYQIDFLPGIAQPGDKPAATLRNLAHPAIIRPAGDIKVSASPTADGYFLEASLPWSIFATTPLQAGQKLGVVTTVSDNDTPATQQRQCLLSSNSNDNGELPQSWALLVLE